jgi:hypothetical protein
MRSSVDSEGFTLLKSWKTHPPEIRGSFEGIGKKLMFTGLGTLTDFDETALRFTGASFELILDLRDAAFDNVATKKSLEAMGLDASKYPESAEIMLGTGDRVSFSSSSNGREEKSN